MPSGRYAVRGGGGDVVGTEDFRCAAGPVGWRYFSEIHRDEPTPHGEIVDVVVDDAWRIVRARVETGEHSIVLEPRDGSLIGTLDGEEIQIAWGPDMHLDYLTPAMNAITATRLDASAEIDVVYLEPVSLEPTLVRQRYEPLGTDLVATAVGRFESERWRYTAIETGCTSELWVAGNVVVRYDRAFELISYEPGATGPEPVPS